MSGIAGIVHADASPVDARLLDRMATHLEFRGPDARQIWSRGGVGFCHTLLRTGPHPRPEAQPCTLDEKVLALADVRLDARDNLIAELRARQRRVSAEITDVELILHAWGVWGEKCVEHLHGDFALAIWDAPTRSLWCARDPMGARPFFYASLGNAFVFSNTPDCVRLHPDVSDALNPRAVGDFLLAAWNPDPATTIFRDVTRLPAGHVLTLREGLVRLGRYWTLPIEEPLRLPQPEDYIESFREILRRAVKDRLPEERAALRMSGGLDSTSVAATAKRVSGERNRPCSLRAFTVDYAPLFADEEGDYAEVAARYLGIPLEVLTCADSPPYERWDEPNFHPPEPCHEPFLASYVSLVRQERMHAPVALSGEGGDAILDGQAWPYLLYLLKPGRTGTLIREFGGFLLKHGRLPPLRGGFRARLQGLLRRGEEEDDFPPWVNPTFERVFGLRERWHELQKPPVAEHPTHPRAYASLTSNHWPNLLESEDAAWTRIPLEVRAPFLDLRMVRFLLRVPPVPWCAEKHLVRIAMHGQLPKAILTRPKTPLQGDPLVAHIRHKSWVPRAPETPVPGMEEFVDWHRVQAVLSSGSEATLWRDARPISFNYWLKCSRSSGRVSSGGNE